MLFDLVAPYTTVCLAGMCKNAGKTTALNALIHGARVRGVSLALTSIGRDGEREDLITGLEMFRDGDVNDKKFQASLFDTFLRAAYLYDGNLRLVLSFTGDANTIDVPTEKLVEDESLDFIAEGFAQSEESPTTSNLGELLPLRLYMGHGAFVLHIPLCNA